VKQRTQQYGCKRKRDRMPCRVLKAHGRGRVKSHRKATSWSFVELVAVIGRKMI